MTAALLAPALFGTIGTARVLGPDVSSWTVTWGRCVVAGVVLAALLAGTGRLAVLAGALREGPVLVAAACQGVFQVCFLTAVLRTGVATTTLVTDAAPAGDLAAAHPVIAQAGVAPAASSRRRARSCSANLLYWRCHSLARSTAE